MRPPLYRFVVIVISGGSMALAVFGAGILLDPMEVTLVTQNGVLLAATLGACLLWAVAFVVLAEQQWGALTFPWQKVVLDIDAPPAVLLAYAQRTLQTLGASIQRRTDASLHATKGSWWSIGGKQAITVQFLRLTHGTRLTIRSRPRIITMLIDGGWNAHNVFDLFSSFKEHFRTQLFVDGRNRG